MTMPKKRHNSGIFYSFDAYGVRSYGSEIKSNRIEINDFAVKVAQTALWIAESQMIKETEDIRLIWK